MKDRIAEAWERAERNRIALEVSIRERRAAQRDEARPADYRSTGRKDTEDFHADG